MYYETLSQEYFKEAEILKEHIKILKKLKTQCVKTDSENEDEMHYRISLLYGMYLELIHTGQYLSRKCEVMKNGKQTSVFR